MSYARNYSRCLRNSQRERAENSFTTKALDLGALLAQKPPAVASILSATKTTIAITTIEGLEQYIFDELYERTKKDRPITAEYILTLQYIAKNLANIYPPNLPYVHDAIEQGDYRRAGDSAVFGYVHFVGKRKNPLTHEDYIHLAEQCYYRWYDKQPLSLGYIVASHIASILKKIQNFQTDMMSRVPAFEVIK